MPRLLIALVLITLSGCIGAPPPATSTPAAATQAAAAPVVPAVPEAWPYPLTAPAAEGASGMVVSDQSLATEVGVAVLKDGGNAVDAAVATAFALAVVLPSAGNIGVAPAGVVVSERRNDMVTQAAGALGFSPPSLVGLSAGAPYFHAGNARTLEELLSSTFQPHHRAFSANFSPAGAELENLVAFLQSIDDSTPTVGFNVGAIDTDLCR
jgi:hypothetical protein